MPMESHSLHNPTAQTEISQVSGVPRNIVFTWAKKQR